MLEREDMSNPDQFRRVEPFESATELQDEHAAFMKALSIELKKDAADKSEAVALARLEPKLRQFLERGAATGVYIEEILQRSDCQVLLDYWVSCLFRAGIVVPPANLAPFDSEKLPDLKDKLCPYVGLDAFRDRANFFGREDDIKELLTKLRQEPLVVVLGASGSGKSSLVMGGILPALKEKGAMPELFVIPPFVPGNSVLDNLVNAVRQAHPAANSIVAEEVTRLRQDPKYLYAMLGEENAVTALITIDQFEEVFTLSDPADREALVRNLAHLLDAARGHRVILTVRAEFDSKINELRELSPSRYWMRPMSYEELTAAVEKPAALVNLQFQSGIVDDLVKKVLGQPAALPLLQFTLHALWEKRKRNRITWEVYRTVGDPLEALKNAADTFYLAQIEQTQTEIKRILLELVRVDEMLEAYRQPLPKSRLLQAGKANTEEVLELLKKNDYLRITPGVSGADDVVEIKHESLVRNWPLLAGWIDDKRRILRDRLSLTQAAHQWEAKGKSKDWDGLFREWQLEEARKQADLTRLEKEFVQASTEALDRAQREKEAALQREAEQREKLKMMRRLAVGFGTAVLMLIVGILLHRYLTHWDYVEYFSSFVKVHSEPKGFGELILAKVKHRPFLGEPRGVGELTLAQVQHRPVSIKIIRKGKWGPVLRMETVNSKGKLTPIHRIGTYLESSEERIPNEVAWEFNYDAQERVSYETALDNKGKRIWGFVYLPPEGGRERVRTGYFVDDTGYPRKDKQYAESYVEIEYRDTGKGIEEYRRYRNRGNQAIRGPDKAFGQLRRYNKKGILLEQTSLGPNDEYMNDEAGNATIKVTDLDPFGFGNPRKQEALDALGEKVTLKSGYSVIRSEYDDNGNMTEEGYFDENGKKTLNVKGYHKVKWKRDGQGNIIKEMYLDMEDKPTVGDRGCYSLVLAYDEDNLPIQLSCFGLDQKLTANKDGYAVWKGKYDVRLKKLVETSYYDTAGRLTQFKDGYARATYRYNDSGKLEDSSYFGADGARTLIKEGYAQVTGGYDVHGQLIGATYFGIKGEPVASNKGYSRWEQEFDNYGNVVRVRYYGPDGKRIVSTEGYTGWTAKHDASGNQIETVYLNVMDKPMRGHDGYAGWKSEYDERGNERRRTYTGLRGEQTLSSDGVAGYTSEYDPLGNEIEQKYFGLDGSPVTHRKGYAGWTRKYDAHGNVIDLRYLDINSKPAFVPWQDERAGGYSYWKKEFNPQNQPIEEAYFGINGEPVLHKDGWARAIHEYDLRGNKKKSAYFGVYVEKVFIKGGYHSVERRYNDQGKAIEISYYGIDDSRVTSEEGYALLVKKYDPFGRVTEQLFYDAKDKPAFYKDEGFHREVRLYDERGCLKEEGCPIEKAYFGPEGPIVHRDGYHKIGYKYDHLGNETEVTYKGLDGKVVMNKRTRYATVEIKRNTQGKEREIAYYAVNRKLTNSNEGFAKIVRTYDPLGQMTSESYFDTNGKLTQGVLGYAETRMKYDVKGKVSYQVYLNTERKPVLIPWQGENNEWGFASYRAKYDGYGNQTEIAYFGIDDNKPIMTGNRYHRCTQKFNSRRQLVEQMTFDDEGQPVMNASKYSRLLKKYDDRGNLTEISAFDDKSKPSEAKYGYARMSMKYDARGNLVEEAYFGGDGRPKILPNSSCAVQTYKYDSAGNQVERACYGDDNALYDKLIGYARMTQKYDSQRRVIEKRYFGTDGKPARLLGRYQHITKFAYDPAGNKIEERYLGINEEPVLGLSPDYQYCNRWTAKYDSAKKLIGTKCHTKQ